MKTIDIYTRKIDSTVQTENVGSTTNNIMKDYVYENIDFKLSEEVWILIHKYFIEYWDEIIGVGGYFCWDDVTQYIYNKIIDQKYLITQEKVNFIVELMLTKIEKDIGFFLIYLLRQFLNGIYPVGSFM